MSYKAVKPSDLSRCAEYRRLCCSHLALSRQVTFALFPTAVNGNQKCNDFGNSECSIFGIKTKCFWHQQFSDFCIKVTVFCSATVKFSFNSSTFLSCGWSYCCGLARNNTTALSGIPSISDCSTLNVPPRSLSNVPAYQNDLYRPYQFEMYRL